MLRGTEAVVWQAAAQARRSLQCTDTWPNSSLRDAIAAQLVRAQASCCLGSFWRGSPTQAHRLGAPTATPIDSCAASWLQQQPDVRRRAAWEAAAGTSPARHCCSGRLEGAWPGLAAPDGCAAACQGQQAAWSAGRTLGGSQGGSRARSAGTNRRTDQHATAHDCLACCLHAASMPPARPLSQSSTPCVPAGGGARAPHGLHPRRVRHQHRRH